jgi:hypothetical protein
VFASIERSKEISKEVNDQVKKILFISFVCILLMALVLPACGCAKKVTETPPPPAEEQAPPPAEEQAPPPAEEQAPPPAEEQAPPPAEEQAPPPAAGELSFTADTFTNADYGYTIKYPKDWKRQKDQEKAPVILYAVNVSAPVPVLSASVRAGATYSETVKASIEASGGSGIKFGPEQEITLPGGNKAVKVKADWTVASGFPGETLCVGVKQGDKWLGAGITTVSMFVPYDEAKFMEVLNTITVTK